MCSCISAGLNRGFLARGDVDKLTREKSHTSFLLLRLCVCVNTSPGWSKALRSTQRTVSFPLCFGSTNAVLQLQHDSANFLIRFPCTFQNVMKQMRWSNYSSNSELELWYKLCGSKLFLINLLGRMRIGDEKSSECVGGSLWLDKKVFALRAEVHALFPVCIAFQSKDVKNRSLLMLWTHYSSTKMMSWSVSYAAMRFTTLALLRDISRTAISWVTSARQSRPRRLFRMNFAANTLPVAFSTQRLTTANFPLARQKHMMWRSFLVPTSADKSTGNQEAAICCWINVSDMCHCFKSC